MKKYLVELFQAQRAQDLTFKINEWLAASSAYIVSIQISYSIIQASKESPGEHNAIILYEISY
jgi:hypothetical protein